MLQPGATIDVSGGSIDYQGAFVQTSRVVSSGHIFDIAQATPDRIYSGLYTGSITDHSKWGIVDVNTNPLALGGHFEPGYVQGANGGAINVSAPSMALDGALRGNTVTGPRQRAAQPTPSTLALNFRAQDPNDILFSFTSPTPPHVVFSANNNLAPADSFALDADGRPLSLREDRQNTVILSPDLVNVDGLGNLRVNNGDGEITLPGDVTLTTPIGGSITLAAANTDVEGKIIAPGGNISLTTYNFSPFAFAAPNFAGQTPMVDPTRGNFTLGPTALLSTAGVIIDDRAQSATANLFPTPTDGGTVSITSYNANYFSWQPHRCFRRRPR